MKNANGDRDSLVSSEPEPESGIAGRIRVAIGDRAVSEFARNAGIGESLLRSYLKGSMPGTDNAVKIARAAGVRLDWLADNDGPMRDYEVAEDVALEYASELPFEIVPQYEVNPSDGELDLVRRESEVGRLAFRKDWLAQKGLHTSDLAVVRVSGDSMDPTIRDGALLLVDCTQQKVRDDGIYVLQVNGHLIAKRVQRDLAHGGLYVKCDNPAYEDQQLTAKQADQLYIIGRVVWAGGEI